MSFDFSQVKKITIPQGELKQIVVNNSIIWKGTWLYTIILGDYVTKVRYKILDDNSPWVEITSDTTIEIDGGVDLFYEAIEYENDTDRYVYTNNNFNGRITEASDGLSVTVSRTRETRYYTATVKAGNYVSTVRIRVSGGSFGPAGSSASVTTAYEQQIIWEAVDYNGNTAQYTYSGDTSGRVTTYGNWSLTVNRTRTLNSYTITWKNYDDTVLKTDTVNYGVTPSYSGSTPTKSADATYTYSHSGWSPTVSGVTGDATYIATFNSTYINYTSYVYLGDYCKRVSASVNGGSYTAWSSSTLAVTHHNGDTIYWKADPVTYDAQYYYTGSTTGNFNGGTGNSTTVNFTRNTQQYTITWVWEDSYGSTTSTTETYYYGATPSRSNPSTVTSGNNRHVFSSWNNLNTVTYSRTINAVYTQQYYATISSTNCSANHSTDWYDRGTVITWTANSNYGFNSSGASTTTATINSGTTYSASPGYFYATFSGTNCYANMPNTWYSVSNPGTVTWTANNSYYSFNGSNTTRATIVVGSNTATATLRAPMSADFTITSSKQSNYDEDGDYESYQVYVSTKYPASTSWRVVYYNSSNTALTGAKTFTVNTYNNSSGGAGSYTAYSYNMDDYAYSAKVSMYYNNVRIVNKTVYF